MKKLPAGTLLIVSFKHHSRENHFYPADFFSQVRNKPVKVVLLVLEDVDLYARSQFFNTHKGIFTTGIWVINTLKKLEPCPHVLLI